MTKRRRSEEVWDEFPASQECGDLLTVSAEGPTVGQAQLEGGPNLISDTVNEGEGQQLAVGDLADMVIGRDVGPRGTEGY